MRTKFGICSRIAFAAALSAMMISCSREPAPRPDAEIAVAEVDGARITLRDLKNEIASRRGFSPSVSTKSAGRSEAREALGVLIERAVVLSEGERLGISVSDSEVEKEIERLRSDFPPGGLEKAILQTGRDMESWRAEFARSLLYRKAAAAIAESRASVSREEVEEIRRRRVKEPALPERIRVRQLLFDTEEDASTARRKIQNAGEDPGKMLERGFAGVRSTAIDLGEVTRKDLPDEVAGELFSLKESEVSGVVAREGSFSLFVVMRKEPSGAPALAALETEIREELLRARREAAFQSWLEGRVGNAVIRVQETLLDRMTEGGK